MGELTSLVRSIAPTYRLASGSPCIGKGTQIPKALWGAETEVPVAAANEPINVGATPRGGDAVQASMNR